MCCPRSQTVHPSLYLHLRNHNNTMNNLLLFTVAPVTRSTLKLLENHKRRQWKLKTHRDTNASGIQNWTFLKWYKVHSICTFIAYDKANPYLGGRFWRQKAPRGAIESSVQLKQTGRPSSWSGMLFIFGLKQNEFSAWCRVAGAATSALAPRVV